VTNLPPPPPRSTPNQAPVASPVADVAPPPPPPGGEVLAVRNISKWFGDVVAVSDVSFSLWPGVTALLGPNGAGKSTMLRMIAGLEGPSQGTVQVFGANPRRDKDVRGRIGIVPQQESLFQEQRAIEFVSLAGTLNGLANPTERAREMLGVVELDPEDPRPISSYSKGMRQRVKVAQALIHQPELLLLDEPLTGLDPRQRLHMTKLIRSLGESGVCVVVSSHVLDEVERLGSRVMVIAQGRLAAQGDFHEIRALMDDRPHRIRVRSSNARVLGGELLTGSGIAGLTIVDDESLIVDTDDAPAFRLSIARVAKDANVRLVEVQPLDDDLESVFKYLVGR
jgi:ABC-2 type transport system ATP-binding protein